MAPASKNVAPARLSTVDEAENSCSEDDMMMATATSGGNGARKTASSRTKTGNGKTTTAGVGRRAAAEKTAGNPSATKKRKAEAQEKKPRAALSDKTNLQSNAPEESGEEEDGGEGEIRKAKRAKTGVSSKGASRKKAVTKRNARTENDDDDLVAVIPETQPEDAVEVEEISLSIERDPEPVQSTTRAQSLSAAVQPLLPRLSARAASVQLPLLPRPSARSLAVQPALPPSYTRERSGSISDTARGTAGNNARRGGDPELRRRWNDLSTKHDELNLKYQNLLELGPEGNFEKLRRATEDRARDASELIASLKKETAELRKMTAPLPPPPPPPAPKVDPEAAKELAALQRQVVALTASQNAVIAERDEAKQALLKAQNEGKSLEAKLVAARQQLSQSAEASGNAKELSGRGAATAAAAQQSSEMKELKMKENLYSDLTGLIVRSVKRKDTEDEYDCIQTGRNGTLHFHLSVANDSSHTNPQTPSGLSWEDAEFAYDPYLDERHDQALLELLPEYLTDGICFPRSDAVKFYSRVLESMTKRIVVEE